MWTSRFPFRLGCFYRRTALYGGRQPLIDIRGRSLILTSKPLVVQTHLIPGQSGRVLSWEAAEVLRFALVRATRSCRSVLQMSNRLKSRCLREAHWGSLAAGLHLSSVSNE